MYAKVFASLFDGSLRGHSNEILVFVNILTHCGPDGVCDRHFRAIADETGLTVEAVHEAIARLESPDPESRTPDEDGRRIARLDEHRDWGWRVVNHGKYKLLVSEEQRREQTAERTRKWRERKQKPACDAPVTQRDACDAIQIQIQKEIQENVVVPSDSTQAGKRPVRTPRRILLADDAEWLATIRESYRTLGVDVDREAVKCRAWLTGPKGRGRQFTRQTFLNWLARCDRGIESPRQPTKPRPAISEREQYDAALYQIMREAANRGPMERDSFLASAADKWRDCPTPQGEPRVWVKAARMMGEETP